MPLETANRGAAIPFTLTEVPWRAVGSGRPVAIAVPLNPVLKFVPKTLTIAPGAAREVPKLAAFTRPAAVNAGLRGVIEKGIAVDVPPPGDAVRTVTCAVPLFAISAAVMLANSCVELTNGVVRLKPFQRTLEPEMNPVPFTVSANPVEPAGMLAGKI